MCGNDDIYCVDREHHEARVRADSANALDTAVRRISKAATDAIEADPHMWSARPCPTCRTVSAILGYDFGCVRRLKEDHHE